jgi:hypothetical protein
MTKLKAVKPEQAEAPKPKILIYGKPGAGKTWASLDFPKVYYIDTEDGAAHGHYMAKLTQSGGAYMGTKQGSLDFHEVIEQVKALSTEKHGFHTLVIDSVSKLFNNAIAMEAERLHAANQKDEYGSSKKPAVSMTRRLISWLMRLDMNVILIAHEKEEWGKNAKGEREQIGSTFDCWEKLEYELNLCLRIAKITPSSRKAFVRKTRYEQFPDGLSFDWSFAEFAKLYGVEAIMGEVKPVVLATPEQVKRVNELLKIIIISPETVNKWFTKAGAESFEEMDTETVDKIINHLQNMKGE